MSDATAEHELRRLRERAWGPGADLDADPEALERLRALEAAVRAKDERPDGAAKASSVAGTPAAPRPVSQASAAAPASPSETTTAAPARLTATTPDAERPSPTTAGTETPPPTADADAAASPVPHAEERPPLRAWFPRRRVPWVASVVAAAAIGAVIAVAGATTVERTGGGQQVGTLATDPAFTPPDFLGIPAESLRGFDEFYGLTVFTSKEEWIGGGTDECLLVVGDGGEAQRQVFLGCGVGAFSASVSFRVQPGMPAELLERYPEGTPLRFERQGSDVRVLAGDAP
ncbi:hypothetical protein [Microbacterium invictum]|uniref:Uncharacterized protein n=1 Tax=Microbacterium invictum TaxID=515415 RepID=A0ABZ0VAI4_9MICO|nr:hypothetical protein [Microbacterium invictum]WQB70628.1 hypothetical protein T9R20_01320 [Microbacterium invictum]